MRSGVFGSRRGSGLTCYTCQHLQSSADFYTCLQNPTSVSTETCAGDEDTCQATFLKLSWIYFVTRGCATTADCSSALGIGTAAQCCTSDNCNDERYELPPTTTTTRRPTTTTVQTTEVPTTLVTTVPPTTGVTTLVTTPPPTTLVTTEPPTTVVTTQLPTTVVTTPPPTTDVTTPPPTTDITTVVTTVPPTTLETTPPPTTMETTLPPTTMETTPPQTTEPDTALVRITHQTTMESADFTVEETTLDTESTDITTTDMTTVPPTTLDTTDFGTTLSRTTANDETTKLQHAVSTPPTTVTPSIVSTPKRMTTEVAVTTGANVKDSTSTEGDVTTVEFTEELTTTEEPPTTEYEVSTMVTEVWTEVTDIIAETTEIFAPNTTTVDDAEAEKQLGGVNVGEVVGFTMVAIAVPSMVAAAVYYYVKHKQNGAKVHPDEVVDIQEDRSTRYKTAMSLGDLKEDGIEEVQEELIKDWKEASLKQETGKDVEEETPKEEGCKDGMEEDHQQEEDRDEKDEEDNDDEDEDSTSLHEEDTSRSIKSSVGLTCYSCQGLRGNSGFDECSRGLTTTETCAGGQDTCQYLFLSNVFITLVKRACVTAADCASSAALTDTYDCCTTDLCNSQVTTTTPPPTTSVPTTTHKAQRSTPIGTTKDTLLTSDKASDSTMMTLTTDLEVSVPETETSTPGFAATVLGYNSVNDSCQYNYNKTNILAYSPNHFSSQYKSKHNSDSHLRCNNNDYSRPKYNCCRYNSVNHSCQYNYNQTNILANSPNHYSSQCKSKHNSDSHLRCNNNDCSRPKYNCCRYNSAIHSCQYNYNETNILANSPNHYSLQYKSKHNPDSHLRCNNIDYSRPKYNPTTSYLHYGTL
ncbi:Hypp8594 [Branchiostoma lanceolatum]|uniref:Hypp8594 protein n=1 Tax=Branchiostoma lanceolatum TaxID=7740 RepID=A0A8J9Z921_BRALA|nr:Hypp8594 [Branchiostoma lanceolatum]